MTSDPNSSAPPPPINGQPPTGPDLLPDDESISLDGLDSGGEDTSVLSFSERDGPSSGVRSWKELVRETAPDAPDNAVRAITPSADGESAFDKDLLRVVLADEPPPSEVILKDPSMVEVSIPSSPDSSRITFRLPPDLADSRPGDSSVVGPILTVGPGQYRAGHDVGASSSGIVPLRAGKAAAQDDSSAVDLGSHAVIDLPFPFEPGGTVDPHSTGAGLELARTDPNGPAAPKGFAAPTGRFRIMGAGAAGLLVGVAACTGLWFAGVLPNQSSKSAPAVSNSGADLSDLRAQIQSATRARDAEAKKAAAATAEAQRMRDDLAQAAAELALAKAAGAQATVARDRADALAVQIKRVQAAQAQLNDSIEKLTAAKATADASLAVLRDRLRHAEADAKAAKEQSQLAEAACQQSVTFATDVARRLGASTSSPADILAALERALDRKVDQTIARPSTVSTTPASEQSQAAVRAGLQAYRTGNYAAAERDFAGVADGPRATALDLYYLGLSQWRLGQLANAEASFRRGWALERASRPPPSEMQAAFERLDRADRDAVNQFRR